MTTAQASAPLVLGAHRTVEEAVVASLRDAILTGALHPGERLAYRDVAGRLGVSMTPVRTALRELANEGLVELRAHTGAWVSALSVDELEEIFVIRAGIEGWLARHGAERLTDAGIAEMASQLRGLLRAKRADDRDAYLRAALAFRVTCYEAAVKPRLLDRFVALYQHSMRYHFLTIADVSRFEVSRANMEQFFAACRARDGAEAERVIQDALLWTLASLTEAFVAADG